MCKFWKMLLFLTILSKVDSEKKTPKLKEYIPKESLPEESANPELCDAKYRYENATPDFMYSPTPERLGQLVKAVLPPIDDISSSNKGGKIIVVGGSSNNPGALYRTAMAAVLLAGPKKVIVVTTPKVTRFITGYGSDLTVYPYMSEDHAAVTKNEPKINKLFTLDDVVIFGPGGSLDTLEKFISYEYPSINTYKVRFFNRINALVYTDMGIPHRVVKGQTWNHRKFHILPRVVLLCNYKELRSVKRYFEGFKRKAWYEINPSRIQSFVMKGRTDYFFDHNLTIGWALDEGGTGNRAAGQGDIFAGIFAVFLNWGLASNICGENNETVLADSIAAYAASRITRRANELGVERFRHGMTSTKMMRFIWKAFAQLFLDDEGKRSRRSEL